MDETCAGCRFWNLENMDAKTSFLVFGECRRYPPTRPSVDPKDAVSPLLDWLWPLTEEDDWCGEFRAKG